MSNKYLEKVAVSTAAKVAIGAAATAGGAVAGGKISSDRFKDRLKTDSNTRNKYNKYIKETFNDELRRTKNISKALSNTQHKATNQVKKDHNSTQVKGALVGAAGAGVAAATVGKKNAVKAAIQKAKSVIKKRPGRPRTPVGPS